MVFYAASNIISVTWQRQQLISSCIPWHLPALGWGSELYPPRTLPQKNQSIQCDSNLEHLGYESHTLPLVIIRCFEFGWVHNIGVGKDSGESLNQYNDILSV